MIKNTLHSHFHPIKFETVRSLITWDQYGRLSLFDINSSL